MVAHNEMNEKGVRGHGRVFLYIQIYYKGVLGIMLHTLRFCLVHFLF